MAAMLFAAATPGPYAWYVSRAAGLVAYVALSASVLLGLLISSRSGPRFLPKVAVFEMHQFLAVLGLALVGLHAGALVFDHTVNFSIADILVPFASSYRPGWVAAGVASAWLSAAIAASFWVKKRIGQKTWRTIHFGSFAGYFLALVHGFGAGTDSHVPVVYWMYVVSAAAVVSLTIFRVLAARSMRAKSRRPAGRRTVAPSRAPGAPASLSS